MVTGRGCRPPSSDVPEHRGVLYDYAICSFVGLSSCIYTLCNTFPSFLLGLAFNHQRDVWKLGRAGKGRTWRRDESDISTRLPTKVGIAEGKELLVCVAQSAEQHGHG